MGEDSPDDRRVRDGGDAPVPAGSCRARGAAPV